VISLPLSRYVVLLTHLQSCIPHPSVQEAGTRKRVEKVFNALAKIEGAEGHPKMEAVFEKKLNNLEEVDEHDSEGSVSWKTTTLLFAAGLFVAGIILYVHGVHQGEQQSNAIDKIHIGRPKKARVSPRVADYFQVSDFNDSDRTSSARRRSLNNISTPELF
jgi:hypothetical protein